jgi:hypothetical protein
LAPKSFALFLVIISGQGARESHSGGGDSEGGWHKPQKSSVWERKGKGHAHKYGIKNHMCHDKGAFKIIHFPILIITPNISSLAKFPLLANQ